MLISWQRENREWKSAIALKLWKLLLTFHWPKQSRDQAWHQQGNLEQLTVGSWQLTVGREKPTPPSCYIRVSSRHREPAERHEHFEAPTFCDWLISVSVSSLETFARVDQILELVLLWNIGDLHKNFSQLRSSFHDKPLWHTDIAMTWFFTKKPLGLKSHTWGAVLACHLLAVWFWEVSWRLRFLILHL